MSFIIKRVNFFFIHFWIGLFSVYIVFSFRNKYIVLFFDCKEWYAINGEIIGR